MVFQSTANDTETLRYILLVLKHTETLKPDYNAIAREEGLSRADKAREKLKTKLQHAGYDLVKGNVVDPADKDSGGNDTTLKKPGRSKRTGGTASLVKKRKREVREDDDDDDLGDMDDAGTKEAI